MDVLFQGCDITMGGSVTDYGAVVAQFTSKDKMSQYTYQCVQDVEYHGCVYNSQVQPFSEIKYEAFMSVSFGISFFGLGWDFCFANVVLIYSAVLLPSHKRPRRKGFKMDGWEEGRTTDTKKESHERQQQRQQPK